MPESDLPETMGTPTTTEPHSVATLPADNPRPASHRFVLPLLALFVLVLGLGMAIGGMTAKTRADDSAQAATENLASATDARDDAQADLTVATNRAQNATSDLTSATAEAQRVMAMANSAASIGDQLCACDQRIADATKEITSAVAARDNTRLQAAIGAYNAAVDEANAALDAYDAAIADIWSAFGSGSASST